MTNHRYLALRSLRLALALSAIGGAAEAACTPQAIACGQTIQGAVTPDDCVSNNGYRYDAIHFEAVRGALIRPQLATTNGDILADLNSPPYRVVPGDDPSFHGYWLDQGNVGSQYDVHPLLHFTGRYTFFIRDYQPADGPGYSLTLHCDAPGPDTALPAGPWLVTPEIPGFRFKVRLGGKAAVQEDCLQDTLCVSGAVAGRTEAFVRIPGPKPNGYLQPNIAKFSTSQLDVWIEQIATGTVKHYRSPAGSSQVNDLLGFYDVEGFLR
jgi:hypothetical protein